MISPSITCAYLYTISREGYPPPVERTVEHIRQMHALGFRSIELEGIGREHLRGFADRLEVIAAEIDRLGLEVPCFCAVLPGMASADPAERERCLELFELGCRIARRLGSGGILDNGPLPPYAFPPDLPIVRHHDAESLAAASLPPGLSWRDHWAGLVDTFGQACDLAAANGLTYQLHPCLGSLTATTDGFCRFRDAVGRDNLRFNVDTANQAVMKDNLQLCLLQLADAIDYIHVSDTRGERIEHLPIGRGRIAFEPFFETLDRIGFRGRLALDIGGAESDVEDLDEAYLDSARKLERCWLGI